MNIKLHMIIRVSEEGEEETMKFVLAPDSFKGTMSSLQVCAIMKKALREQYPDSEVVQLPIADGGEGSIDCFLEAVGGVKKYVTVSGPFGEPMKGYYGILNGGKKTAIIEMAVCAGLPLVSGRENPETATTYGVGELIRDAVKNCTCPERIDYRADNAKRKVVLWDFGAKENIARELVKRGCDVIRVPSWYTAEQILALKADGLMLTNGPGDPAENTEVIGNIAKLAGKLPIFGICLGHQLFALAMGGKTKKMKYGHRGANQPVKELATGTVYISSQNHGYEVLADSIKDVGTLSFINANDNTCEGVEYPELNAFTVQFHPEACAGPLDARDLFDRFMKMMDGGKKNA